MLSLFFIISAILLKGQDTTYRTNQDSTRVLNEITVHAYEYDRPSHETPGAISILKEKDFNRFTNTSIVPVINTIPGVRMEERSPGSYRLSIRGSTLRSPFGVRNVKIYWNDLPLTDPGGNSYLNLLDFNSIEHAEVIKGPGSSLYGAGTGGILMLRTPSAGYKQQKITASCVSGTFGLSRYTINYQNSTEKSNVTVQYAHQQATGYREQTKLQRDFVMFQGNYHVSAKNIISTGFFYTDLYYQTPGALTKTQYDENPRQARPTIGANPGAVEQKAAVYNKTIYTTLSQEYNWNKKWSTRNGGYATFTAFKNPTLRNFERRVEQSYGARSVTKFSTQSVKINFGGEYQRGFSPIKTYDNNGGSTGVFQTDDEIVSSTALIFSQIDWSLPKGFDITAGVSYNFYTIDFDRFSTPSPIHEERSFTPVLSPRVALLKKINSFTSFYGSYGRGFSPPTVAELYPSTGVFDKNIKAENGNNYEVGVKGSLLNKMIQFDIAAYSFQLKQTIVPRKDTSMTGDPEFFVNAGNTSQKGLEVNVSFSPQLHVGSLFTTLRLWSAGTFNHYRFIDYSKDNINYGGNILTGTSPNIIIVGLDLFTEVGIYTNLTYNFTDRIPLNDANSAFANSYHLFGCRFGYRFTSKRFPFDAFCGIDNLLNQKYSLGNDLNAAGGRYYNAAPTRNFFIGIKFNLIVQQ